MTKPDRIRHLKTKKTIAVVMEVEKELDNTQYNVALMAGLVVFDSSAGLVRASV